MSKLSNNKGMTLVELLVVLVLSSVIIIATTSLIISASKNNNRIIQETKIRDEADYLMSLIMREFYTIKKSNIVEDMEKDPLKSYIKYTVDYDNKFEGTPNTCDPAGITPRKCIVLSGFIREGNQVLMYIKGKSVNTMDPSLKITENSAINIPTVSGTLKNSSPSYQIKLELENTRKETANNKISFENEITIINN
ncbi:prepilin-type N-terminal cleavage/methylation domain-containing protein [Solibacillus sp. FSL W8-0372]|uniref:prepilin-type N-terminal cleavage/methylation domain-containing protein n=1 Tax=Solibacillus sp. FSL W8-0372 TaxID=2921713 RepID=UPI0030CD832C